MPLLLYDRAVTSGTSPDLEGIENSMNAYDRWADYVLRTMDCPFDPLTEAAWSRFLGASVATLRGRCRAAGVAMKDTLDFARLLRAVFSEARAGHGWDPAAVLESYDLRTIRRLFDRGGLGDPLDHEHPVPPAVFLNRQRLIEPGPALNAVRRALDGRGLTSPPVGGAERGAGRLHR